MMPRGKGGVPEAMASPVAAAATASTGNGQRRSSTMGPHTRNARTSRRSGAWGYGPVARASTASTVQAVSTVVASHWRSLNAAGTRRSDGPSASSY